MICKPDQMQYCTRLTCCDTLGRRSRLEWHSRVHWSYRCGTRCSRTRVAGKLVPSCSRHGLEWLATWTGLGLRPTWVAYMGYLTGWVNATLSGGDCRGVEVAVVWINLADLLGGL